ncbi:MAG: hypothetical protein Q8O40_05300, partial [Chloroflexota bacterium]|nr:hypothetical protein [Chloroflexota bacterium]
DGWRRQFDSDDATLRGYFWFVIDIFPITTAGDQSVKARACGGAPTERVTEISAPSVGDAVKGCVYEREGGIRTFNLFTATRNVGLTIQAATNNPGIANAAVVEVMASLANLQIAVINQAMPAGPVMTVATGTPKFQFTALATLPAADPGKPYQPNGQPFSFCDPPTIGFTTQCPPPGSTERNPSGGSPPYHFQYGTLGGFPPFGLSLGKDGQLTGTPHPSTVGKTYRFTVCAIDLKADFVCREVSITVTGTAPTPTPPSPTPTPRPTATPTAVQIPISFAITSASCRYLRSTGPVDREYEVLVSGTAAGPVGALLVMPSLPGYIRLSWSSSWGDGTGTSRYAERQPSQPGSTSWTATLVIGGGPSKTVTVDGYVRMDTTRVSDSRTLTCQSPS